MAAHGWGLDAISGLELAKLRTSLMLSQFGGSQLAGPQLSSPQLASPHFASPQFMSPQFGGVRYGSPLDEVKPSSADVEDDRPPSIGTLQVKPTV